MFPKSVLSLLTPTAILLTPSLLTWTSYLVSFHLTCPLQVHPPLCYACNRSETQHDPLIPWCGFPWWFRRREYAFSAGNAASERGHGCPEWPQCPFPCSCRTLCLPLSFHAGNTVIAFWFWFCFLEYHWHVTLCKLKVYSMLI